jgi:hypothetical protein
VRAEFEAERVPVVTVTAKYYDRVGVSQWIDLRSDVGGQSADHRRDQQQANRYHPSSNAAPAPRVTAGQRATPANGQPREQTAQGSPDSVPLLAPANSIEDP